MAIETTEYLRSMMPRMIRAAGRRAGDADPEDLADLIALREVLDAAIRDAVTTQRETYGRSWADVARGIGVGRQTAYDKYRKTS
jgi:hypothetical protein